MSDLRPHLAAAAAVVVPLRLGGGTRLKIVEAMAMGKAVVSTSLGAEGIEAVPGHDLLIEDEPVAFADAVNLLLAEPDLAARIGQSARQLAVEPVCVEQLGSGARVLLPSDFGWRLVKAALIGAGQIAQQHLTCLKSLPGVELAAVCDLSPATAEAAAERYGIRAWFTDHRPMLEKVRPEVVHVTTPPASHFKLAVDSFDAGAHVIVEKPATLTFEELNRWSSAHGRPAVTSSRTTTTSLITPPRRSCDASSPVSSGR